MELANALTLFNQLLGGNVPCKTRIHAQWRAIARAVVKQPKLLIADEISAMLDPSTTATMLRLLKGLQISEGFAMLYTTHDVSLARKIADTVYVMQEGTIIENGPLSEVFTHPKAPFTQKVLQEAQRYAALSEQAE